MRFMAFRVKVVSRRFDRAPERRGVGTHSTTSHTIDRNTTRSGIGDKTNATTPDNTCGSMKKRPRIVGGYRLPTTSYPETGYGPGLRFARQVTHSSNSPAMTTSRARVIDRFLFLAATDAECTADNTRTGGPPPIPISRLGSYS